MSHEADDRTVLDHEAYALNTTFPLPLAGGANAHVTFAQSRPSYVIIETIKPVEDGAGVILRIFEAHGHWTSATLAFESAVRSAAIGRFDETTSQVLQPSGNCLTPEVKKHEVISLRVVLRTE